MRKIDKRDRAVLFRERLAEAMRRHGVSGSALARDTGVDRSTISQLLAPEGTRMPNAHFAADAAAVLGVSTDWLLGLTDRPERPGDLVDAAVRMTTAERSSIEDRILDWHREAQGYKIRHVPATMPDMLKTEAVLRWEYQAHLGRTPDQAIGAMQDRLDWLRSGSSDYEIALPLHEIITFAEGVGYWSGLDAGVRADQLARLATFSREHFPGVRLFLFDARRVFSAPLTVFGPLLAVLYIGRFHLAFRESTRVRSLTQQFDWLVREAEVDARDVPDRIDALRGRIHQNIT